MDAVSPKFLVTDISDMGEKSRSWRYLSDQSLKDSWRVRMIHGYFKDTRMDFFFDNEAQADRFSPWQIYDPTQIIDGLGNKREALIVQDIEKIKGAGPKNAYTDRPIMQDMWRITMANATQSRTLQITSPAPQRGSIGGLKGGTVTTQDLFGTLETMPASIDSQLAQLAQDAADAQAEAAAAKAAADAAAAAAAQAAAQLAAQLAAQAAAQAAASQAAIDQANAIAAQYAAQQQAAQAAAAQAAANAAAASLAAQRNYLLHKSAPVYTDRLWQITKGGSWGQYNGVVFGSGQAFDPSHPFTGQWYGTFYPIYNGVVYVTSPFVGATNVTPVGVKYV